MPINAEVLRQTGDSRGDIGAIIFVERSDMDGVAVLTAIKEAVLHGRLKLEATGGRRVQYRDTDDPSRILAIHEVSGEDYGALSYVTRPGVSNSVITRETATYSSITIVAGEHLEEVSKILKTHPKTSES